MMQSKAIVVLLAVGLFATPLTRAETTGRMQGRVVDGEDAPLPGVSVAITSPSQIGGEQTAMTDPQGTFRFPTLSPGDYRVVIALDGFVTQELTEVQVRLDRTTELRVTLSEATVEDEIVVVETTPVVDPEQTSTGQTFTTEYLKKASVGMNARSYLDAPAQAAGVERAGSAGGTSAFRVHGSDSWESSYLIDGLNTQDTWGGGSTFEVGFDSIQEIAVHTAGFGAEYGLATGGVVNVVTKSGGNELFGSLDLRYRDANFETAGEQYDPDEEPSDSRTVNLALGGPVLRDRLWFFVGGASWLQRTTPVNTPYSVDTSYRSVLGKLTWQAGPGWSVVGRYLANPWQEERGAGDQFRSIEATNRIDFDTSSGVAEVTGILTRDLVWNLRLGGFDASVANFANDGDLATIGHLNVDNGERYGNVAAQFYNDWGRFEADTDLSWFVRSSRSSHEIKAGARWAELDFSQNQCRNGSGRVCTAGDVGFTFFDAVDPATGANVPLFLEVVPAEGPLESTGTERSLYVDDTWRVIPRLTLRVGLRWDEASQRHRSGTQEVTFEQLQPRLGAAWDVAGDGRNILRASWGRFMHPSTLALSDFFLGERSTLSEFWLSCTTGLGITDPEVCAAVAGSPDAYRTDPESWDPAGWLFFFTSGAENEQNFVDPDLAPMHVDQLVLGFERELLRRTSLELSYVRKDWRDLIEDTCVGNVPTPSPDADCTAFLVANLPVAERDYEAWALRFESRALDRLHGIASWVYSESKGSHDGFIVNFDFDVFPEHWENRYGYLADHSRHRVKLNGFIDLPWDLLFALGGYWQSEQRWTPVRSSLRQGVGGAVFTEPRGARKGNGLSKLDLQLTKSFRIGPTRLALIGTVYNALDSESPVSFCQNVTGCGQFELGDAIDWQRPRSYEVGLRLEFN